MNSRTQIVFFHGLEGGPGGRKHRWLLNKFSENNVHCTDMDVSLLNIRKTNSLTNQLLMNMFSTLPWNLLSKSIQSSLNESLNLQMPLIEELNHMNKTQNIQNVLIASSYGGAVATLALSRGEWTGPTILLAPAYGIMGSWGEYTSNDKPQYVYEQIGKKLTNKQKEQCCIIHGTNDTTINLNDSIELSKISGIRLRIIEGGDHRLNDSLHILEEELLQIQSLELKPIN
mmetsp:Transcript_13014/g.15542  ORF Transcript_13014/g.15542 Transcript_13014/m.15542 type:complete len:229 (+) Transcript_13014:74-760(+)